MAALLRKFRTHKAKKRARLLQSTLLIVLLGVIGALCWGMVRLATSDSFIIKTIHISGNAAVASTSIEEVVLNNLEGKKFFVVPKKNSLLLSKSTLLQEVSEALPRLKDVHIARDGFQALTITVTERKGVALWCGDIVPHVSIQTNELGKRASSIEYGTCFLMDDEAIIFSPAPSFTGNPLPRFYGAVGNGSVLGQTLLPKEEYNGVLSLFNILQEAELSVTAVLLVDEREYELYLSDGTRVLFSRNDDAKTIATRLAAVLASEALQKESVPIEYIDLRFGKKVFYKTVGASDESPSTLPE